VGLLHRSPHRPVMSSTQNLARMELISLSWATMKEILISMRFLSLEESLSG
jgi:hypothetical protein